MPHLLASIMTRDVATEWYMKMFENMMTRDELEEIQQLQDFANNTL